MRDKFIELLDLHGDDISFCSVCDRPTDDCEACKNEQLADYLLANNVIALPCSIDCSELFMIVDLYNRKKIVGQAIAKYEVDCIIIGHSRKLIYRCCNASNEWVDFDGDEIGKTVFLTRKEAEEKLKEEVK